MLRMDAEFTGRQEIEVTGNARAFLTWFQSKEHGWLRIDDGLYAILEVPDDTHLVIAKPKAHIAHLN